jgi:thiol-disulfide isomerase/thioredoxin
MVAWKFRHVSLVACGLLFVAGCGSSEEAASSGNSGSALPTAAIAGGGSKSAAAKTDGENGEAADDKLEMEEPKPGTPEYLVRQATVLQLQPGPKTEDVEKLREHRRERNEKIVALCQEAISMVHNEGDKQRLFDMAVRQLMEARLQLALMGDRDSIDSLYEDAAALYERDPQSAAAAEGAYTLVNLAYNHAKATAAENPQWLLEFAKQARHFASTFPAEERRSVPLLYTAARSCEINGLPQEALQCYSLIQTGFPTSPFAQKIAGTLRRLKLVGNPPQIGGPTADGEFVTVDDLLGKPVLIVFWSSEAKPFEASLPELLQVTRAWGEKGLTVIGINLDQEAAVASQYVVKNRIPWTQITFPEAEKRGWNNPIVTYYGVTEIPAIWLIDASGNVISTTLSADRLDAKLAELLEGKAPIAKSDSAANAEEKTARKPTAETDKQ